MSLMTTFTHKGFERIAGGYYCSVYARDDDPWVIKQGYNDGTRTYLEWCMLKTARGERMRGMPQIDFLVDDGDKGYIVAMKRYELIKDRLHEFGFPKGASGALHKQVGCPTYLTALVNAVNTDLQRDCDWGGDWCNDVHWANVMLDVESNDIILTDPSSALYLPLGRFKRYRTTTDSAQLEFRFMAEAVEI